MLPLAIACDPPPLMPPPNPAGSPRLFLTAVWGLVALLVAGFLLGPRYSHAYRAPSKVNIPRLIIQQVLHEGSVARAASMARGAGSGE